MRLDVKGRIGIAMAVVVTLNIVTGGVAWSYYASSARYAEEARIAAERAHWVEVLSGNVIEFVGEANDLALGLASDVSAEGSAEYGDVMGLDNTIGYTVDRPVAGLSADHTDTIRDTWIELRTNVYVWLNSEAQSAGSSARLKFDEDGRVRASVSSNIATPSPLVGLSRGDLRREVRRETESFTRGLLTDVNRRAIEEAANARAAEVDARRRAVLVTVILLAIGAITAIAVAMWLYRTIATPLNHAKDTAGRVSAGELDAQFEAHSDDEIGMLVHAVEDMRDTVVSKVLVMREMAGAVLVTADEVAQSAERAGMAADVAHTPALGEALEEVAQRATVLRELAGQMLKN